MVEIFPMLVLLELFMIFLIELCSVFLPEIFGLMDRSPR